MEVLNEKTLKKNLRIMGKIFNSDGNTNVIKWNILSHYESSPQDEDALSGSFESTMYSIIFDDETVIAAENCTMLLSSKETEEEAAVFYPIDSETARFLNKTLESLVNETHTIRIDGSRHPINKNDSIDIINYSVDGIKVLGEEKESVWEDPKGFCDPHKVSKCLDFGFAWICAKYPIETLKALNSSNIPFEDKEAFKAEIGI